ncbi:cupin domain-containing protein [Runella zeae]|uniref:cupin domain-containing protein n=1 Tax=Runella zeae TaxID=94255 RepID=UPI002355905E|nr:cupin domain-containing protein [Runella zeae]
MEHPQSETDKILLQAGEGRTYNCGTMTAVFKADENETANKYSISEWWLEPNSGGPGPHSHEDNDEVFYGIEGTTSILVGDKWYDIRKGAFYEYQQTPFTILQTKQMKNLGFLISLFQVDLRKICLPL